LSPGPGLAEEHRQRIEASARWWREWLVSKGW